jgi:hypothetical protein
MALDQEINAARKEIVSDGYEMSIGELMNLYRDEELRYRPCLSATVQVGRYTKDPIH